MIPYTSEQTIRQLEKRKGGYLYLEIEAEIVNQFENKRNTRLICTLDQKLTFQCGLNHLGKWNYFIILPPKSLKSYDIKLGDAVQFEIRVDPNPLGVNIPDTIESLLEQDEDLKSKFHKLSLGKQRSIIFYVMKIKDIDRQIEKTIELIHHIDVIRSKRK
ncbi:MAG TPA: DUF1905 domain-containing protein [Saprospiraceae bacterium]|nr:DUF1905 domain-containing protein [Saprospiraceae bacterium]